jgi:hypothetical protein
MSAVGTDRSDGCDKVVIVPQFQGTCWFNALLVMLFSSEGARDVLLDARRHRWGQIRNSPRKSGRRLGAFFSHMLDLYKSTDTNAFEWYIKTPPEKILYYLYRYNPRKFALPVQWSAEGGFTTESFAYWTYFYAHHLLNFLKVPNVQLDAVPVNPQSKSGPFRLAIGQIYSRPTQKSPLRPFPRASMRGLLGTSPRVILVTFGRGSKWRRPSYHMLRGTYSGLPRSIQFGRHTFLLDSLSMSNADAGKPLYDDRGRPRVDSQGVPKKSGGHVIAGVTCNGRRFVYSGWMKKTRDKSKSDGDTPGEGPLTNDRPCPLMPYDWERDPRPFFVTTKVCQVQMQKGDMRFNGRWGERTLVYVRKDLVHYKRHAFARAMAARREGRTGEAASALGNALGRTLRNLFGSKQRIG